MATEARPPAPRVRSASAVQSSRLSLASLGTFRTVAYGLTVRFRMEGSGDGQQRASTRVPRHRGAAGRPARPGGRTGRAALAPAVAADGAGGPARGRRGRRARADPLP